MTEPVITYLIFIDSEGDIKMVKMAKGTNPAEDSTDANGWTIKYYYQDLASIGHWMDTHAWNGSTFVTRTERPNKVATWSNNAWSWDADEFKDLVREQRNGYLFRCDWAMCSDSPLTESEKDDVITYRNDLRNITDTTMPTSGLLDDVSWPTAPSCLG